MPQSLSRIDVHLVFATKGREPWLRDTGLRESLHRNMGGGLKNLDCQAVEIGGVEDHVHLLCLFSRTGTMAEVVKERKRLSSAWLRGQDGSLAHFHWQSGYGVFSVSASNEEAVAGYIRNQERHHRKLGFEDEYRAFFKRHAVAFDERYVWD